MIGAIRGGAGGEASPPAPRAAVSAGVPVERRPTAPGDDAFLLALYRSTREDELALTGWAEPQRAAFVRMQFMAQRRHYEASYPDATHEIVLHEGRPIGRLLVARDAEQIHLVDIALLPEHRGQGIGEALVRELLREGDEHRLPVRLSVLQGNPAMRLYERLGFAVTGADGLHLAMERRPRA